MKNLLLLMLFSLALVWASCQKNDGSVNTSIAGNWSVVMDTTWTSGIGPYGTPSSHKYAGVPGDYYNFTTAGKLYVKEGTEKLDTADYTVSGDTLKLTYNYLYEGGVTIQGAAGRFIISTLNNQNLVLTQDFATPGGIIDETVVLKR
jgi:hypothetical protein